MEERDEGLSKVLIIAQSIAEYVLLILVVVSNFLPNEFYEMIGESRNSRISISIVSELLIVGIIFFSLFLYLITKPLGIKKPSKDNVDLLRVAVLFMIVFMIPVSFLLGANEISLKHGILIDTLPFYGLMGIIVIFPSIIAAMFYPFLRLIDLMEKSELEDRIGFGIMFLSMIIFLLVKSLPILSVGFLASKVGWFIRPIRKLLSLSNSSGRGW